jgi:hypothetical protein
MEIYGLQCNWMDCQEARLGLGRFLGLEHLKAETRHILTEQSRRLVRCYRAEVFALDAQNRVVSLLSQTEARDTLHSSTRSNVSQRYESDGCSKRRNFRNMTALTFRNDVQYALDRCRNRHRLRCWQGHIRDLPDEVVYPRVPHHALLVFMS